MLALGLRGDSRSWQEGTAAGALLRSNLRLLAHIPHWAQTWKEGVLGWLSPFYSAHDKLQLTFRKSHLSSGKPLW